MAELLLEERLRDFQYHHVGSKTAELMAAVRERYYILASFLVSHLPYSREQSLALTALEESSMRAIQCLAVVHGQPVPIGETWTDARETGEP